MSEVAVNVSNYNPEAARQETPLAPIAAPQSILTLIAEAARDPNVNVNSMQILYQMQKDHLADEARRSFNRDYMAAKQEMPRVKKDGKVEYAIDKSKPDGPKKEAFRFPTYETIEDVIKPIEKKYGFAHFFDSGQRAGEGGGIVTFVTLIHRDGHERTTQFSSGLDTSGGKSNLQGMHSSHSLGKRVALMSAWGIVQEGKDDSGEGDKLRYITDDVKQQIVALIQETKTDTRTFLDHFGVNSVDEILHKNAPGVINALNSKKSKMKAV